MRNALLILFACTSSALLAQSYCEYDALVQIDMGPGSTRDTPEEILQQDDGKIIGIGTTYYINSNHFEASLFRLNTDNTFDQSFGVNGRVGHHWDQRNTAVCASLDEDGKIYVGGYQAPGNGFSSFRAYVGRLNSDGTADTSFAQGGSKKLDIQGGMKGSVVGIDPLENGGVRVAMITDDPSGIGLVHLTSEGELDTTFSDDGIALIENSEVFWQTDYGEAEFRTSDSSTIIFGKALTGGQVRPYLAKIDVDGNLDSAFSDDGQIIFPEELPGNFSGIYGTLTIDGEILFTCSNSGAEKKYRVYKVDGETGQLVTSFGVDGISRATAFGGFHNPWDIIVESNTGDILVLGEGSTSGRYPTIWRIDTNGIEVENCGTSATQIFFSNLGSNGFHAGMFDAAGDLRILGETGQQDTTSGDDQSLNMMIPFIQTPSSLDDFTIADISVYPNPSSDFIQFENPENYNLTYSISDITGKEVLSGRSARQIDISKLSQGLHIISLTHQNMILMRSTFIRE